MSPDEAAVIVEQFSLIPYFPSEPGARMQLSRLLQRMCRDFAAAQWLVDRAVDLYSRWPGPHEIRAVYCSKYLPQDGTDAYSECFPEGIPRSSSSEPQRVIAAEAVALPSGDVSCDAAANQILVDLAEKKSIPRGRHSRMGAARLEAGVVRRD